MGVFRDEFRTVRLVAGAHPATSKEMCIMEAEAYIAGERHSDHPNCVSPMLAMIARRVNDYMTQEERDEFIAPMLGTFAGTRGNKDTEIERGYIIVDYHFRIFLPMLLDAWHFKEAASLFRGLNKIADKKSGSAALDALDARAALDALAALAARAALDALDALDALAALDALDARAALAALDALAALAALDALAARRRNWCELSVRLMKDLIAVHSDVPKEWAREPESLPCAVCGGA